MEERFDTEFSKNGGYLCQYDPDMETHTSNPEVVKTFIKSEINLAISQDRAKLIEEIEKMKPDVKAMTHDLQGKCDFERMNTLNDIINYLKQ